MNDPLKLRSDQSTAELADSMDGYRAYPVDAQGVIEGPAIALQARCEEDALSEARRRLGKNAEVWIGVRLVSGPSL